MDRRKDLAPNVKGRVAVIGGGWGGCAAAVEMARRGLSVSLFEAARTLGGRARRVDSRHGTLDNGQHILSGAYTETLRLMRRVGADPEDLLLRLPLTLSFPGEMDIRAPRLPAPLHLAAALLGAKGLSWPERLAASRLMLDLKLQGFTLEKNESVAELLARQRQPERLRRLLWEPLSLAALNTPAQSASAQVFAHVLRDSLAGAREASDLLLPRTDLSALFPEPAAEFLRRHGGQVHLSRPVKGLSVLDGDGFRLSGEGWSEAFSAVVLAVAPCHAAALLPDMAQTAACRAAIGGLSFEPIATCTLGYDLPVRLPCPMIGLTNGPGQWLFDHSALVGGAPALAAVISGPGPHQDMGREQLAAAIHEQICGIAGPLPAPRWHQLITEKRATFSCRPNLIRPAMETGLPGLLLCGDYVASIYPATLETAVRSGIACAEKTMLWRRIHPAVAVLAG
ncbi:MAG: hydroxysqualene dehydroxylase HpnE [Rhodocyclaceae bacterium]|nr:hydroxysqualene dehydroxylase HpnE [Rhodocyclaceae bacterium]